MIRDKKHKQVEPAENMTVRSCYSGREYKIKTIDYENGRLYCLGDHMLPMGLDYELVKR